MKHMMVPCTTSLRRHIGIFCSSYASEQQIERSRLKIKHIVDQQKIGRFVLIAAIPIEAFGDPFKVFKRIFLAFDTKHYKLMLSYDSIFHEVRNYDNVSNLIKRLKEAFDEPNRILLNVLEKA